VCRASIHGEFKTDYLSQLSFMLNLILKLIQQSGKKTTKFSDPNSLVRCRSFLDYLSPNHTTLAKNGAWRIIFDESKRGPADLK